MLQMVRSHEIGLKMIAKKIAEIEEGVFTNSRYHDLITLSIKDVVFEKLGVTEKEWDKIVEKTAKKIGESQEEDFNNRNSLLKVDRVAKDKDWVMVSFVGKIEGEAFDGGSSNGTHVVLGDKKFLPELEQSLEGKKAGDEYDVELVFPESYAPNLKGKKSVFSVKVISVKEKIELVKGPEPGPKE